MIEKLFEEIDHIVSETQCEGWDGYDADPVSMDSVRNAKRFIRDLQPLLPDHASIVCNGEITFHWHRDDNETLAMILTKKDTIIYALLSDTKEESGEVPYGDTIPSEVMQVIEFIS